MALTRPITAGEAKRVLAEFDLSPHYLRQYEWWIRPEKYLRSEHVLGIDPHDPQFRYLDIVNFCAAVQAECWIQVPGRQEVWIEEQMAFFFAVRVGFIVWTAYFVREPWLGHPPIGSYEARVFWDGEKDPFKAVQEASSALYQLAEEAPSENWDDTYGKWRPRW